MIKYPNVYTDISFNAFESNFWGSIFTLAYSHSESEQEIIRKKIIFGTDWPLSLLKISTAAEYIRRFDKLPLDNEFKYAMVNENPRNFGFRD
jgi:predicted TIM-barrel fold metal-dependent hydrolase